MTILRIPEPVGGYDRRDLNRDGIISWWEKAIAAAIATGLLGLGVWVLLQLLYVGACFLFGVVWADGWSFYKRPWFGGTIALVAGLGLALYAWRMVTPEKSERLTRADIEHQRKMQKLELKRAKLELDNLRGITDHEPNTTYSQLDIDAAARAMLLNYFNGQSMAREAMVEAGIVKKAVWDKANKLLLSRKVRVKNRIAAKDFAEAWARYVEGHQQAQKREWKGGGLIDTR